MPSQVPQSASLEHITRAANGWAMLLFSVALLVAASFLIQFNAPPESPVHFLGALIAAIGLASLFGFFTLQPNEARVLILFGAYKGTVRNSGFHWANPLYARKRGNVPTKGVTVNDSGTRNRFSRGHTQGAVGFQSLATKVSLRAHNFNSGRLARGQYGASGI
jgi:hypothetical protein